MRPCLHLLQARRAGASVRRRTQTVRTEARSADLELTSVSADEAGSERVNQRGPSDSSAGARTQHVNTRIIDGAATGPTPGRSCPLTLFGPPVPLAHLSIRK